jgi:uncharacterized protein YjbI with pentapeptide repeats
MKFHNIKTCNSINILIIFTLLAITIVVTFCVFLDVNLLDKTNISLKDKIEISKTIATSIGGVAILFNLYYTSKQKESLERTSLATLKNAQAAEDKQITERYSKAIEQLGSETLYVQLGAIYSLERIARDSDKDYWNIIEILTTYIREEYPKSCSLTVEATLKVIKRMNSSYGLDEWVPVDFSNVKLEKIDFSRAKLNGANFEGANLTNANFEEADLTDVNFKRANLNGANFKKANLQNVNFTRTSIYSNDFSFANLKNTNFEETYIININFSNADLSDANFAKAITWDEEEISNNYFTGNYYDEETGMDFTEEVFYKTNFYGAILRNTNLEDANFKSAINLTKEQLKVAKSRDKLILNTKQTEMI